MFKGLIVCTCACAAALPALAGDKPAKLAPAARALQLPERSIAYGKPAARPAASAGFALSPATVRLSGAPVHASSVRLSSEANKNAPSFGYTEAQGLAGWRLTSQRPFQTAEAGGSYAVRDYFAAERKPRFRRSALGALLVLKIDGQSDSPPISVGGGGVASALWQVVPK
jgi:hypothetical protein